jgi:D-alanyl-D-alanine dipeptidase
MNFPLYKKAAAYMRRPAAEALKKIQEELRPLGYGLKIYDGYRPYDVTVLFYERFHDTAFVASPYTGSRHNRGCAVDLTLIDLKTGKELDMPTPYDSFTKQAHCSYPDLPANVLKNRELLQTVMIRNDFMIYPDEWWHYDFAGWTNYPVMNIPFEKLP